MNDEFDERRQNRKLFKSLPQWFCFANYQSVNNLDPLGWYVQITCRQVCFSYLIFMRDPDPFVDEKLPIVKRALARLPKDPICDLSRSPFNDGVFSLCHGLDFPDGPVVRSMTLWDLCLIDRNVRLKLSQDENDVAQRIASDRSPSVLLYHPPEWMKATVDDAGLSNSTLPLVIDLSFPNSVLQRHFEAY